MNRDVMITAMREVLQSIQARKSLADVLQEILKWACQLTNSIHGSFVTVDHERGVLLITSTHGPDWTPEKKSHTMKIGEGITGLVAATGKPYLCSDTTLDPLYVSLFDFVESELAVPVIAQNKVWGIINFDGRKKHEFNETTVSDMELFAQLTAAAIDIHLSWSREQRLQQELMQAEKLSSFSKMLSGFAHEINNPLAAILGGASVLAYDSPDSGQRQELEAIAAEAQRAATLVKNLLAFSRRQTAKKEVRDINVLVQDACALAWHQLKQKGISLVVSLSEKPPHAEVQPLQIQQVLLNLFSNAESAIAEEGRPDGEIRVAVSEENGEVLIEVADNGVGMESETRRSIYDPFFTTRDVGKGAGLGLSIAHDILSFHGGSITCKSGLHAGSIFYIRLPASRMQPEAASVIPPPATSKKSKIQRPAITMRVLVVDDEDQIRTALERFLSSKGFHVETAVDGMAAHSLAHEQDFDVVLSDIRMPRMDGFELYRALNEINELYGRRFVFMTGNLITSETHEFIQNTKCPCIEKPFQFDVIFKTLLEQSCV